MTLKEGGGGNGKNERAMQEILTKNPLSPAKLPGNIQSALMFFICSINLIHFSFFLLRPLSWALKKPKFELREQKTKNEKRDERDTIEQWGLKSNMKSVFPAVDFSQLLSSRAK